MNKVKLIDELTSEKVVEEWERDLIMSGTLGGTGLLHLLLGSVAKRAIRHSIKPLFIIRSKP